MVKKKSVLTILCVFIFSINSLFANEPLGLVLTGSSSGAYSHIGVLRALEKSDIKPDFIVATSVGAIIGLLYASGFSPDDIQQIFQSASLSDFYRTVKPDKNGKLYSSYFDAFISDLYSGKSYDIKECIIPIIIPTEDPISGRQIIFTEGEISDIMGTLFAMSYMTEPVNVNQNEGLVMRLEDSGKLDLWSLNIAETYSRNLIVSTATYEPQKKPEVKNVALIGNISEFSSEKTLADGLFASPYAWIKTDLSEFSDAAYADDLRNIIILGEATTDFYFSGHPSTNVGSFSFFLYEKPGFTYIRNLREKATDKVCKNIGKELENYIKFLKRNPEMTENAPGVELKNFFYSENLSSGLYTFFDMRPLYIRTGIRTNFFTFWGPNLDLLPRIKTTLFSDFSPLTFSSSAFSEITEQNIIIGLENKKMFNFPGLFTLYPYISAEMALHYNKNDLDQEKYLVRSGIELFDRNHSGYDFSINPYVFCFSERLSKNIINNYGFGGKFSADLFAIPHLGYKIGDSFRYQKNGEGIVLNKNDGYRGRCPADKPKQTASTYLNLLQMEWFWYLKDSPFQATETIKLEKIKMGIYYDLLTFKDGIEQSAGIFIRPQIIQNNFSLTNLEVYAGYDTSEESAVIGFTFTQHW